MPSDGKSSYCLWQGELIRGKKCQKIVIIELDLDIHKTHTYHTLLQADISFASYHPETNLGRVHGQN
jgi:hypothetical protein